MRVAQAAAFGLAHLAALGRATEVAPEPEGIPWCIRPDAYVTQPALCEPQDDLSKDIDSVANPPKTWCEHRQLLASMEMPFGDLQFDCYEGNSGGEDHPIGSACMKLPHEGTNAVCDESSGLSSDYQPCTDISDGAMMAGDIGASETSLALTTKRGKIVLANMNTDRSGSFDASTNGGPLIGFGASPLLINGSTHLSVVWGADEGSRLLRVWTGVPGDTSMALCTEIDVGAEIQATVALPLSRAEDGVGDSTSSELIEGGLAIGVLLKPYGEREAMMKFYEAPLGDLATCSNFTGHAGTPPLPPQPRATWKIAIHGAKWDGYDTKALRVKVVQHQRHDFNSPWLKYNIMCFPAEVGSVRNLVVLYDDSHIAFYHYDHFPAASTAPELTLSFGNEGNGDDGSKRDPSLFYTAPPNRRINSIAIWGSCTNSAWNPVTQESAHAGQLMWMAVGTEKPNAGDPASAVEVRALPEFAYAATHCLLDKRKSSDLRSHAFRANHPAWRCPDHTSTGCCYWTPTTDDDLVTQDGCDELALFFDSGSSTCEPRAILNSTNTPALRIAGHVPIIDIGAGRQLANGGEWKETELTMSASSFTAQFDSLGLGDAVGDIGGDGNETNSSSANSSAVMMGDLNTVQCGASVCDISDHLFYVLFIGMENRTVEVVALQEQLCRGTGAAGDNLLTSKLNSVYSPGDPIKILNSPNAQHLFVIQMYRSWQLNSRSRLAELCKNASDNPADPFFTPWIPVCARLKSRALNIFDFLAYYSVCRTGYTCASFQAPNATTVSQGEFTARPIQDSLPCPRGFFCVGGSRYECLPGFVCPDFNMSFPKKCDSDPSAGTTCYAAAMIEPLKCPSGFSCLTPGSQPWGAPPGRFVPDYPRDVLYNCSGGDFCPYMAYNESNTTGEEGGPKARDMRCPDNFYCIDPGVRKPDVCYSCKDGEERDDGTCDESNVNLSSILYCPKGTQYPEFCPAGTQCQIPNTSEPCKLGMYCPAGTAFEELCPAGPPQPMSPNPRLPGHFPPSCFPTALAGTFCPAPNVSLTCPRRFFCRRGTHEAKPCTFPTAICPEGSRIEDNTFTGIIVALLAIFSVGGTAMFLLYQRQKKMRELKQSLETAGEMKRALKVLKQAQQLVVEHEKEMKKLQGLKPEDISTKSVGDEEDQVQEGCCTKINHCLRAPFMTAADKMAEKHMAEIGFFDLSLFINTTGKQVLHHLNGVIRPSALTAIMGPSGSGKTSFMTALAGRAHYGTLKGTVLLNGLDIDPKSHDYQRRIGFVPQNDIMHANLTVFETLMFSSRIRLPGAEHDEQMKHTNHAISQLRLDDVQHSIVGDEHVRGVSGGQKKRVNIGIELVAHPSILFCDEATSGLDSGNSLLVARMLHKIAQDQVTVVTVLHQPREEIFECFDEVILLGVGGRTIYHGEGHKCVEYFFSLNYAMPTNQNPADFLIDVVVGDRVPETGSGDTYDTPGTLAKLLLEKLKQRYPDETERSSFAVFRRMDEDGHGVIHYLQFEHLVHDLAAGTVKEESIKKVWDALDEDSTDLMTSNDFGHFLREGLQAGGASQLAHKDVNSRAAKQAAAKQQAWLVDQWKQKYEVGDLAAQIAQSGNKNVGSGKKAGLSCHDRVLMPILGFRHQLVVLRVLLGRDFQQFIRSYKDLLVDLALYTIAGVLLGTVFDTGGTDSYIGPLPEHIQAFCHESMVEVCAMWQLNDLPVQASFTVLALGLLGLASASRVFGREKEKVVWFRESEARLPTLPYFISKMLIQSINVCLGPFMFLIMYYSILQPRMMLGTELYQIFLISSLCAFGWGYLISIALHEKQAILASILLQLIMTMLSGSGNPTLKKLQACPRGHPLTWLMTKVNYCRWIQEWYVITELEYYATIYNLTTTYENLSYDPDNKGADRMNALIIAGVTHFLAVCVVFWRAGARGQEIQEQWMKPLTNPLKNFLRFVVYEMCCPCLDTPPPKQDPDSPSLDELTLTSYLANAKKAAKARARDDGKKNKFRKKSSTGVAVDPAAGSRKS